MIEPIQFTTIQGKMNNFESPVYFECFLFACHLCLTHTGAFTVQVSRQALLKSVIMLDAPSMVIRYAIQPNEAVTQSYPDVKLQVCYGLVVITYL